MTFNQQQQHADCVIEIQTHLSIYKFVILSDIVQML